MAAESSEAGPHFAALACVVWTVCVVQLEAHFPEACLEICAPFLACVAAESEGDLGARLLIVSSELREGVDRAWRRGRADVEGAGEVDEEGTDGRARRRRGVHQSFVMFCNLLRTLIMASSNVSYLAHLIW